MTPLLLFLDILPTPPARNECVSTQIRRRAADAASRLTGGRFGSSGSGGYGGFSYGGLDMSDEERRRLLLSAPDFLATSSAPGHPGHYHQVGVRGGRARVEAGTGVRACLCVCGGGGTYIQRALALFTVT